MTSPRYTEGGVAARDFLDELELVGEDRKLEVVQRSAAVLLFGLVDEAQARASGTRRRR